MCLVGRGKHLKSSTSQQLNPKDASLTLCRFIMAVSLRRVEPAKPLNDAQIGRSFYFIPFHDHEKSPLRQISFINL